MLAWRRNAAAGVKTRFSCRRTSMPVPAGPASSRFFFATEHLVSAVGAATIAKGSGGRQRSRPPAPRAGEAPQGVLTGPAPSDYHPAPFTREAATSVSVFHSLLARSLPLVPKPIVGRVSRRYIAGDTLQDAVKTVRDLNAQGFMATLDVLGESVTERRLVKAAVHDYESALDAIRTERLDSNIS